jgi:hypothetical protein
MDDADVHAVVDFFDPNDNEHVFVAGPFKPRSSQLTDGQLVQEGVARAIESGELSPHEARQARKVLRFVKMKT